MAQTIFEGSDKESQFSSTSAPSAATTGEFEKHQQQQQPIASSTPSFSQQDVKCESLYAAVKADNILSYQASPLSPTSMRQSATPFTTNYKSNSQSPAFSMANTPVDQFDNDVKKDNEAIQKYVNFHV